MSSAKKHHDLVTADTPAKGSSSSCRSEEEGEVLAEATAGVEDEEEEEGEEEEEEEEDDDEEEDEEEEDDEEVGDTAEGGGRGGGSDLVQREGASPAGVHGTPTPNATPGGGESVTPASGEKDPEAQPSPAVSAEVADEETSSAPSIGDHESEELHATAKTATSASAATTIISSSVVKNSLASRPVGVTSDTGLPLQEGGTPPVSGSKVIPSTKIVTSLGGGAGVKVVGSQVRAQSMPLLVSMAGGGSGISLLPAGLPPGRYVIVPGSAASLAALSTASTTTTTTTTTLAVRTPMITTSASSSSPTITTPTTLAAPLPAAMGHPTLIPRVSVTSPSASSVSPVVGRNVQQRERGRRKSYTAAEKLAMIAAVEGGERKSTVADRFGVAPSTLACILAQKHKIRRDQDSLSRRRLRSPKIYPRDVVSTSNTVSSSSCGSVAVSSSGGGSSTVFSLVPSSHSGLGSSGFLHGSANPFSHFLAPLSPPSPPLLQSPVEEIVTVPDLVERMVEGGEDGPCISGGDTPGPSASSPVLATSSSPAVTLITTTNTATRTPAPEPTPSVEVQKQYEPKKLIADCLEEGPVIRETEPSNVGLVQGLAGPYLLKKETHCTSILDQLLRDETYADVTLTAEGQNIRAHRVILSLASNYFRHVLSRDANVQSVVVLRDVKFAQLQNIIHFIYTGETTVDASQLDGFMKTAELLEITSLSDGHKALGSRGLLNTTHTSETLASQPDQRTPASKRTRPGGSECSAKTRRISGLASSSSCDSREEKTLDPMSNVKVEPADEVCKRATGSKRRLESIDDETGTNGEPLEVEVEEISQNESLGTDKEGGNPCNTTSNAFSHDDSASSSPSVNTDAIAAPGRCPYCPHLSQQFMDVAMMRHLLVTHPCKPAFPCDVCWRVYVRRNHFKAHQRVCNNGEKLAE